MRSRSMATPGCQFLQSSSSAMPGKRGINSRSAAAPLNGTIALTIKAADSSRSPPEGPMTKNFTVSGSPIFACKSFANHALIATPSAPRSCGIGAPCCGNCCQSAEATSEYGVARSPTRNSFTKYVITPAACGIFSKDVTNGWSRKMRSARTSVRSPTVRTSIKASAGVHAAATAASTVRRSAPAVSSILAMPGISLRFCKLARSMKAVGVGTCAALSEKRPNDASSTIAATRTRIATVVSAVDDNGASRGKNPGFSTRSKTMSPCFACKRWAKMRFNATSSGLRSMSVGVGASRQKRASTPHTAMAFARWSPLAAKPRRFSNGATTIAFSFTDGAALCATAFAMLSARASLMNRPFPTIATSACPIRANAISRKLPRTLSPITSEPVMTIAVTP